MNVLDIDCKKKKVPSLIGVGFIASLAADIVRDLNVFRYPFKAGGFDEVHILSALFMPNDPVKVTEDVYGICKPNGTVVVVQPYFRAV